MADVSTTLERAFELIKQGEKAQAAALLKPILRQDRRNVDAWWLLANATSDPAKKARMLERVLAIQPGHQGASNMLARMQGRETVMPVASSSKPNVADKSKRRPTAKQRKKRAIPRVVSFLISMVFFGMLALVSFVGGLPALTNPESLNIEGDSPERVTYLFLGYFLHGKFDEAKQYTCSGAHAVVDSEGAEYLAS